MASTAVKCSGLISMIAIFAAVWLNRRSHDLSAEIPNILDSLRRAEKKVRSLLRDFFFIQCRKKPNGATKDYMR